MEGHCRICQACLPNLVPNAFRIGGSIANAWRDLMDKGRWLHYEGLRRCIYTIGDARE